MGSASQTRASNILRNISYLEYLIASAYLLYNLPDPKEQQGHTITRADILTDTLFGLISSDGSLANFRCAQQVLPAPMAAATPPHSGGLKITPSACPGASPA